jgi:hypothetical protein
MRDTDGGDESEDRREEETNVTNGANESDAKTMRIERYFFEKSLADRNVKQNQSKVL